MIGNTIANGKIRISEKIGEGAFASVYGGIHIHLDRPVAIKVLKKEYYQDQEITERFITEARAIARLEHPNIVHIFDCGFEDGYHYFVMSRLQYSLSQLIREKGKLSMAEAIRISIDVTRALNLFYEKKITHRDIKSDNILFNNEGDAILTDFGIATGQKLKKITQAGTILGTPHYMAPEQIKGKEVDHRSDLYSFGIVMYEMMTGDVPFTGNFTQITHGHVNEKPASPSDKNPNISKQLSHIIMKLIEKNRDGRYQNSGELLIDLERLKNAQLEKYLKNAENAKLQNNIGLELLEYEEYLKLDPKDSEIRKRFDKVQQTARRDSHIRRAKKALDARNYADALTELKDALRLDPENEEVKQRIQEVQDLVDKEALIKKANNYEKKGDTRKAIEALEKALTYDPSNEVLTQKLKELKKQQEISQYYEEIEEAKKERNLRRERELSQKILTLISHDEKLTRRVEELDVQIELDELFSKAQKAEEDNDLNLALEAYQAAFQISPQKMEIEKEIERIQTIIEIKKYSDKAEDYLKENNVKLAILELEEALRIDPQNVQIKEKKEHLQNIIRRDMHIEKAKEAESAEEIEIAIHEYELSLSLDPDNSTLAEHVSQLKKQKAISDYTHLGQKSMAEGDYDSALEMYLHVQKLSLSEEIEHIVRDLRIKKKVADCVKSAEAHVKDGNIKQALIDYDEAYSFEPTEELERKIDSLKEELKAIKEGGEVDGVIVEKKTELRIEPSPTEITKLGEGVLDEVIVSRPEKPSRLSARLFTKSFKILSTVLACIILVSAIFLFIYRHREGEKEKPVESVLVGDTLMTAESKDSIKIVNIWNDSDLTNEQKIDSLLVLKNELIDSARIVEINEMIDNLTIPPPPSPTGTIRITSNPSGAFVYLNGKNQNKRTPCDLTGIPIGTGYRIVLKKDGYEDWGQSNYTVNGRSPTRIDATLIELPPGSLRVHVHPFADMYLDDESIASGVSDAEVSEVSPMRHVVRFSHPRFGDLIQEIEIRSGEERSIKVNLLDHVGTLWVKIRDSENNATWGHIFINGQDTGETESYRFEKVAGTYRVSLQRDGFRTLEGEKEVTVRAEHVAECTFILVAE